MGERGNITLDYGSDKAVTFYTHWYGDTTPTVLKGALMRSRDRWDDEGYLARIIFCDLVGVEDFESTNGYGIYPGSEGLDANYMSIVVDMPQCEVRIGNRKWSFEEYVEDDITGDLVRL